MNYLRIAKAILSLLLCSLIVLVLLPGAFAQETTAGITGHVKDQSGAVVSNATVEVTSPALIGSQKAETDSAGSYQFSRLPPGTYTLQVSAKGFRSVKQEGIDLSAGRLPVIDIALQVGAITETVNVTSEAPMVDVTSSKVVATLGHEQLSNLPTGSGRSFQSFIPFAAGARAEPLQGTTGGRANGFQIDGASDGENVYMIDGVNVTQIQNGGVGKNFQTDFTQEVEIKSSSFEAEYGGALGGVINAVPKHGSNEWHGSLKFYYQSSALDAVDPCASGYTTGGSTVCGLRLNPALAGNNTATSGACVAAGTCRLAGTPQYYVPKKDNRHTLEPGYEVGGPLLKDRVWLYSSFIPSLDTIRRTTTFTGNNPGARTLSQTTNQYNMFNRLDYRAFSQLRLYAGWNYAYSRLTGQLGSPDSAYCADPTSTANCNQINTGRTTDPNTFRADNGSVNPLAVWDFGGDWTPTSKLVVSARYGYFFANNEDRGKPIGIRDIYEATVNAASRDLAGQPYPSSAFNTSGFANIPSNSATLLNPFKRKSWNADASYFVGNLWGAHTFKFGYFRQYQENQVFATFNPAVVDLWWGTTYSPVTSASACDAVKAGNVAAGLPGVCQGRYGYFLTGFSVSNTGGTTQTAQAIYFQDSWTVGHGLTLNLGVRFDQETLPPYDPKRFPTVDFGWGDKVAPRIGGAYDLLHNGKVKVYASYGKFFDIMKMGLARGSFGSDYWHNCVYALDTTDFSTITPTGGAAAPGGCPASGPAPGIPSPPFRFIENVDFRATKADPRDPAISPTMKPMAQHEFVAGVDWAISPNLSLETRYARKRLDNTIEDMSITDNLGFYIGNPGTLFADLLHRPTVIPDASGNNYLNNTPFCAECPGVVPATRRYDGLEFRLTRRGGAKWYGSLSYTYSKLEGNYPGLTNSDPTDGGGGRHAPNNSRLFDLPNMTYLPNGKIDDGPLPTDRPHTAKAYGYYNLKWLGMTTTFGIFQTMSQGSPIDTCLSIVGTGSACEWAAGRGNVVHYHRDPTTFNLVQDGITMNARSDNLFQTDFEVSHEIAVSKTHEQYRLVFSGNVVNLLNQHAATGYNENVMAAGLINPQRASRFPGDPLTDWGKIMNGFNPVDAFNGAGAFAGNVPGTNSVIQPALTLNRQYELPNIFQTARQIRLSVRFQF